MQFRFKNLKTEITLDVARQLVDIVTKHRAAKAGKSTGKPRAKREVSSDSSSGRAVKSSSEWGR
jgi:hypothetical protein